MNDKIQLKRGTLANWLKADPVLADGEMALVATNQATPNVYDQYKVGGGSKKFSELPYQGLPCLQELGASTTSPLSQKAITDWINKGYQFREVATPSTNPGTPDGPVFYFATKAGIYANFNSISVADGEVVILQWNDGAWTKKVTGFANQKAVNDKLTDLSNKTEQIKNENVSNEEQSVCFASDDGTKVIHTIDKNHADFTNLHSSGKKVLTEDDTAEYVSKKYVESELGKKQDKVDGLFNKETTDKSDDILFTSDDYDGNNNGELYMKVDKDGVHAKVFLPLSLKEITLSYPKRIFTVFNDFGIDAYDNQFKNMYNASGYHNTENKKIGQQTFPWNINSRSYSIDLWLDNMLSGLTEEPKIGFGKVEGNNKVSFFQHGSKDGGTYINSDTVNGDNTIFELDQTFEVGGNDYSSQTINIKQISVKSSASKGKKCILLPIGDSTVNGTNAYINTPYPTSPYQWWAWTKAYFDMDKIEDAEQVEMKTIGITSANTYDIKLSGLEKNNIRTYGMGIGGSNASTWRAPEMTISGGSGYPNAFMNNGVFSINYFLENWRTCDDNGVRLYTDASKSTTKSEGTSVKGYYDDGTESTFYIGKLVTDTSACDVCLPTHIAIQLGFNGMNFDDYDAIISGDLGYIGKEIVQEMAQSKGYNIKANYNDCGVLMFDKEKQDTHSGGSGCACIATLFSGYFFKQLKEGKLKRILLIATGALMNSTSMQQGETIPGIAHAISIEM